MAVSELLLIAEDEEGGESSGERNNGTSSQRYRAFVHGVMADGEAYESDPDGPSSLAGRSADGEWWAKGKLTSNI